MPVIQDTEKNSGVDALTVMEGIENLANKPADNADTCGALDDMPLVIGRTGKDVGQVAIKHPDKSDKPASNKACLHRVGYTIDHE
jgi:hypothetical protein